ncbi:hypothetical protein F5J12DRAFT_506755 [Pisolithus orientalis]|uniref:uncharacterized protein n=1 Tax=Pisolithus orientalis TaxID=936130 RepID=UPI0022247BF3|nr:uncharacterized protein F5J12DRAFT_506755 [Pisolithus orientalis]KAI5989209.1 hypothetical protein F5J12DRAFT_506755 [Pisolithus orientalis]
MSSRPYSGAAIRCGPRHDHRYRQCVPDQFIGQSNREYRFSVIYKEYRFGIPSRSDLPFGSLLPVATILIVPVEAPVVLLPSEWQSDKWVQALGSFLRRVSAIPVPYHNSCTLNIDHEQNHRLQMTCLRQAHPRRVVKVEAPPTTQRVPSSSAPVQVTQSFFYWTVDLINLGNKISQSCAVGIVELCCHCNAIRGMLDERQEQHHMQLLLTNGKSLSVFIPADEVKIDSLPLVDFSEHLRKTYRRGAGH